MALASNETWQAGFVRDEDGRLIVVVAAAVSYTSGSRDADGRLQLTAVAGS